MNQRMNIPQTLEGIREEDIPHLAQYAAKEANPSIPCPGFWTRKLWRSSTIKPQIRRKLWMPKPLTSSLRASASTFKRGNPPGGVRIAMLQRLRETVRRREPDISKALTADLGKERLRGLHVRNRAGAELSSATSSVTPGALPSGGMSPRPGPVRRVQLSLALPLWERVDYEPWNYPFF